MWSFTIHDTISGDRLFEVHPSSGRWGRTPGAGDGEHVLMLRDTDTGIPRAQARSLSAPNGRTIAVAWNGVVVYAGLIIRAPYSREIGALTLRHVDVRTLFGQRLTFGVSTYPDGDLAVSGKNLSGLVRAIMNRGVNAWGSTWRLPLDLPADGSGSHSLDVKRWEWATIEDLLVRVEKLGAMIDFDPYYDSNGDLRWATRVGTPNLPGSTSEFVATAEHTPITNLSYELDGSRQLSGCFYMGMGTEADMRFGEAGFIGGPTIPVRDAARSAKDVSSVSVLNQMALTDLQKHRAPIEQWSFDIVIDETVNPHHLRPGGKVTIHTWDDPYIPDGAHSLVVTGLSGDMTRTLTPEVTPV